MDAAIIEVADLISTLTQFPAKSSPPYDADVQSQPLTADQRNSFVAALFDSTMDTFDYFIVVLVSADIAETFTAAGPKSHSSRRPR